MKHFYTIGLFLFGALAVLSFGSKTLAAGDPGSGFTITPPVFDLKANPGDNLSEVISLYNNGSEDLNISSTIENLKPVGEVGQVQVVDEGLPSLKDWVKISQFDPILKQGETRNISFSIEVPASAEPGGHFATILFGPNANSQSATGNSAITQKIGSLVLLTVSGEVKESASILKFSTDQKNYFDYKNIKFEMAIRNDGNSYIRPKGFISLTNLFGKKIAQIEVDGKNILPEATRQITSEYFSNKLFGPYTANLTLVYGDSNQNLNYSIGFWVIPWKQTAAVLAILIVFFLLRKRLWRALLIIVGKKKS